MNPQRSSIYDIVKYKPKADAPPVNPAVPKPANDTAISNESIAERRARALRMGKVVKTPTKAPTMKAPKPESKHSPVSEFIDLEDAFRKAPSIDGLRTILTTGARKLATYDVGMIVERESLLNASALSKRPQDSWRVKSVDGTTEVDRSAIMLQEFETLVHALVEKWGDGLSNQKIVDLDSLPNKAGLTHFSANSKQLFWLPLKNPDGALIGAFIALRAKRWNTSETALIGSLASPWVHAYQALPQERRKKVVSWMARIAHRQFVINACASAVILLAFPVRFSVLAPAEVVGASPDVVSAPIGGIVSSVLVEPGQAVRANTPLVKILDTELKAQYDVAARNAAAATAMYQRVVQPAVSEHRGSNEISTTRADLEVARAELQLAEKMLERSVLRASQDGIAMFSAREDWLGKPVVVGERIVEIVDPNRLELKIELAPSDAMAISMGKQVKLFLDGKPFDAIHAKVSGVGYQLLPTDAGSTAYRIVAQFDPESDPRLGARGTARISGDWVPLGFYILRRPITFIRQKLGV